MCGDPGVLGPGVEIKGEAAVDPTVCRAAEVPAEPVRAGELCHHAYVPVSRSYSEDVAGWADGRGLGGYQVLAVNLRGEFPCFEEVRKRSASKRVSSKAARSRSASWLLATVKVMTIAASRARTIAPRALAHGRCGPSVRLTCPTWSSLTARRKVSASAKTPVLLE